MKEVPFPVAQARRRARATPKKKTLSASPWRRPDPFRLVSVEERRRTVLRERPVLFWSGPSPAS